MKHAGFERPKRSLGQNFLQDGNIVRKIVDALALEHGEAVLEIGPGRGALTSLLLTRTARVMALEKDRDLASALHRNLPSLGVVNGDGLTFCWEGLAPRGGIKIVGNLPYNVASPMMWEIVSRVPCLNRAVFMIQKEVALRLVAGPGSRAYGALSVWMQSFVRPELLFTVPPTVFVPRPKVDSAVVAMVPSGKGVREADREALTSTVHRLFQRRRKQIGSTLKKEWSEEVEAWALENGVERTMRPENLTPTQFLSLGVLLRDLKQERASRDTV
jgi:16S rRNA (adenine1518-N6/adenine1519-N6)-dimethyltransferase